VAYTLDLMVPEAISKKLEPMGEESEEVPRDNKTRAAGLFELHACTTFIN